MKHIKQFAFLAIFLSFFLAFSNISYSSFVIEGGENNIAVSTPSESVTEYTVQFVSDGSTVSTIYVEEGDFISPYTIEKSGYSFGGWFSDSTYTTLFNFTTDQVESDLTLYAKWVETTTDSNCLTSKINSTSSGSTLNVLTNSTYLTNDTHYDSTTKRVYIYSTEIKGKINLCYSTSSSLYPSDAESYYDSTARRPLNLEYKDDALAYCVVLLNDITINSSASLSIGAEIGSAQKDGEKATTGANGIYSTIYGAYVQLDLNGHTITNNGTINNYGSIIDSVGTGEIINNGTIQALLEIEDNRGGNNLLWLYGKQTMPFTQYRALYLDAKITFNFGSKYTAFVRFNLGNLGGKDVLMYLIGPSTDSSVEYFCTMSSGSVITREVYYNQYMADKLSEDLLTIANYDSLLRKEKFILDGIFDVKKTTLDVSLSIYSVVTADATVDIGLFDFPISSYYDVYVINDSKLTLHTSVNVLMGVKIVFEEDTTLVFSYQSEITYNIIAKFIRRSVKHLPELTITPTARINCLDNFVKNANADNNGQFRVVRNNNDIYGGPSGNSDVLNKYDNLPVWKCFDKAEVFILGSLQFTSGNSREYLLGGNINLSDNALSSLKTFSSSNSSKLLLHTETMIPGYGYWFGGDISYLDLIMGKLNNNQDSYLAAYQYRFLPLISYGKVLLDVEAGNEGAVNINGDYTYDYDSGIISNGEGNSFVLIPDSNYMLEGETNSAADQDNAIDYNVSIKQASTATPSTCSVLVGSQYYIYYCGLFIPTNTTSISTSGTSANATKFFSNHNTTNASVTFTFSGGYWRGSLSSTIS